MTFANGTRLGPYEILAPMGEGGMGEVYRARDTSLKRDVALKVLPGVFAQHSERMARFQREAHLLAALNHPNVAAIHGLEEASGVRALVMELVEGPMLAGRMAQGPIPLADWQPMMGSFHPMTDGWPIHRRNPAERRFTLYRSRRLRCSIQPSVP